MNTPTVSVQIETILALAPKTATLMRAYLNDDEITGVRFYRPSEQYGLECTLDGTEWKPSNHHRADLLLDSPDAILIRTPYYFGG